MKIIRTFKLFPTYVACLMLAFAMPMTAYAQEGDTPSTEQVQTESPAAANPTETSSPATSDQSQPETQTQTPSVETPVQSQPSEQPVSAPNKKLNSNKWQWDPVQKKYVRKLTVVAPNQAPSNESTSNSSSSQSNKDVVNSTAIANALDSLAVSGDAKVLDNGTAGSATSGNSNASATIINNINSSLSNSNNKEAATFTKDIMGDVNGDLMLEPMLLKAMLEANAAKSSESPNINAKNNASITNDANLAAISGNAAVKDNRSAGNATSGSANTVVDVVNIVNSIVAANQSFMGTVNIYGNLNGDILIAPDFIPQMIASNGGSTSNANNVTKVSSRDTQDIVNNVSLAAESGKALVRDNGSAGNATSGDAKTNLTIFNMTGHDIVASNSLLVFVNVLGTWVGMIVDAPEGATAAAVGNNVTKNDVQASLAIDTTNNAAITNNLDLYSRSGNAVVADNGSAGNATSGNATASANIANISNSSMGVSGWFGVLFINVFGSWNGSFGVDTAAGNQVITPAQAAARGASAKTAGFMKFVPRAQKTEASASNNLNIIDVRNAGLSGESTSGEVNAKTASATESGEVKSASDTAPRSQQSYIDARKNTLPLMIGSIVLMAVSGFALRKYLF